MGGHEDVVGMCWMQWDVMERGGVGVGQGCGGKR